MPVRNLAEVRVRLEKAVAALPGEPTTPADQFERLEMVAIQILDSEHTEFTPGILEEYLMTYLYLCQLELGLQTGNHDGSV
jgi:hypothetical protein